MSGYQFIDGESNFSDLTGFKASGVHCDVRGKADGRLDLALVLSECPSTCAGVFTRNRVAAAPVQLGRTLLAEGDFFKGFVVNSGNANACTGRDGMLDALAMQQAVAAKAGCEPGEIFVCSTGRIGEKLPMERLVTGIDEAVETLSEEAVGWEMAADAILTSDTCRKTCSVVVTTDSGIVHITGMAKGAGMIEPNMATMLGFICTDAALSREDAQELLKTSVDTTFNAISVDGDESTNDTVLMFANGSSGVYLDPSKPDWDTLKEALHAVCHNLAQKIVGDGEKITKVVEICIEGAATEKDAKLAARSIANSLLVKSSWYGNDPNWGRIMDALGYSGAELAEDTVRLGYASEDTQQQAEVFDKGNVLSANKPKWREIVSQKQFKIIAHLGSGDAACRVWSTDLTEGYVNFNKSE